jgi:hypothetical protein
VVLSWRRQRVPVATDATAASEADCGGYGSVSAGLRLRVRQPSWRARLTKEDEVANVFNASANSVSIHVDVAVTDQMAGDADLAFARTRHVASSTVTLSPGLNTVPDAFWSAWSVAGNAPSFSHVI